MEVYLSTKDRKIVLRFPIVQAKDIEFTSGLISETFENSQGKSLNLIGEEDIRKVSFSSFFPHKRYRWMSFFLPLASTCLDFIFRHRKESLILTIIGARFTFTMPCIIKEFKYKERENRDILYSISFEEDVNKEIL